jgi:hypothetical protein
VAGDEASLVDSEADGKAAAPRLDALGPARDDCRMRTGEQEQRASRIAVPVHTEATAMTGDRLEDESAETGSGAFAFVAGQDDVQTRAQELYAAFARATTAADETAQELARQAGVPDIPGEEHQNVRPPPGVAVETWQRMFPGGVLEDQGRRLLSGLGGQEDIVYAAPTENDHVCYALLPNGGGGCERPGPDGLTLGWTYSRSRSLVVYGLMSDAVAYVEVVVDNRRYRTRTGENAFGVRLKDVPPEKLSGLLIHRKDGSHREVSLRR